MLALKPNRQPATEAAPAEAPKAPETVWAQLDIASLPEDLAKLAYAWLQAESAASTAKAKFREEMQEAYDVGAGNVLLVNYKYGHISVGIAKDKPRSAKGARSMADIAKLR